MKHRRKKLVEEINLTPLLDILFSILFIVMMSAASEKASYVSDTTDQAKTISQLQSENEKLRTDLKNSEYEKNSIEEFQQNAVVITVTNRVDKNKHILEFFVGKEPDAAESIQLGNDRSDNTTNRIQNFINNQIVNIDNVPVYIVFYCDKNQIYTKEFITVTSAFEEAAMVNKAVFYKLAEEENE